MPNIPFTSTKELVFAGGLGLGTYGLIYYGGKIASKMHPLAGALVSLGLGALAAFGADKVFRTDAYAKGVSIAGILGMIITAGKTLLGLVKGTAGFGGIAARNTAAHYAFNPMGNPMGAYYQAQAGLGAPFQQALAAPFYQAQAGMGEYYGTGEYVSNDGAISQVSDFGEYVASHLNVEGYGDYEVQQGYTPGADGFGYVNDGVRPGSDLGREFDMIEAAAGLGAAPGVAARSDYIPTVQAGNVGSQETTDYSGVFDVGGPNGVFG